MAARSESLKESRATRPLSASLRTARECLISEREAALLDHGRAPCAAEHEPCRDGQPAPPGEDALAFAVEAEADASAPLSGHDERALRDHRLPGRGSRADGKAQAAGSRLLAPHLGLEMAASVVDAREPGRKADD